MWMLLVALAHADPCDAVALCGIDSAVDTCFIPTGSTVAVCRDVRAHTPKFVCEETVLDDEGTKVGTVQLYCGTVPVAGACLVSRVCPSGDYQPCVDMFGTTAACSALLPDSIVVCGFDDSRVACKRTPPPEEADVVSRPLRP